MPESLSLRLVPSLVLLSGVAKTTAGLQVSSRFDCLGPQQRLSVRAKNYDEDGRAILQHCNRKDSHIKRHVGIYDNLDVLESAGALYIDSSRW